MNRNNMSRMPVWSKLVSSLTLGRYSECVSNILADYFSNFQITTTIAYQFVEYGEVIIVIDFAECR